jgi:hypothetical protein
MTRLVPEVNIGLIAVEPHPLSMTLERTNRFSRFARSTRGRAMDHIYHVRFLFIFYFRLDQQPHTI